MATATESPPAAGALACPEGYEHGWTSESARTQGEAVREACRYLRVLRGECRAVRGCLVAPDGHGPYGWRYNPDGWTVYVRAGARDAAHRRFCERSQAAGGAWVPAGEG